jgi:Tfp pilus assembly protein PilN
MSAPNELSFLPDDYLERKRQRRTNVICATLFAAVMGTIGTTFSFSERSLRSVERQHMLIDAEYTDAAKRIEQVQQLLTKQRTMARQAEITAALLEKVPRSNVLAEITNGLPSGVSLTDFVLESKKRQPATPPPSAAAQGGTFQVKSAAAQSAAANPAPEPQTYDVFMKLSGLASTDVQVAQLISRLNRTRIFKDVNLLITDTFQPTPGGDVMRKFQIELALNNDADVQTIKDTKTAAVEIK